MMERAMLAEECRKIERKGGNVLEFLREQGCISPWRTWFRLQKEELGRNDHQITDGKGKKTMKEIITKEQKAEAVRIAIEGGDPIAFFMNLGSTAPEKMWSQLRMKLKDEDPETYAQLPARVSRKHNKGLGGAFKVKKADVIKALQLPEEAKTVKPNIKLDGFTVTGIKSDLGEYTYSEKYNWFRFNPVEGSELDMNPEEWDSFLSEVPRAMEILGVKK